MRTTYTWGTWLRYQVAHKFRLRVVEWLAAIQLTWLGIIFLMPHDTFDLSATYMAMREWGTETQWGTFLLLTGITGLIGLFINGSMESVTPWIRVIRAIIGAIAFSMISVSLLITWLVYGNPPSTGIAMYVPCTIAEFWAIYNSITDARTYHNGVRTSRDSSERYR